MTIPEYIKSINKQYKSGISGEHTHRRSLENLIRKLIPDVEVTNEPRNVTDCGNPDYVITKKKIDIGFIEAKDIGKDINSKQYKEQFTRYRKALDNLIITDYMYFQFYEYNVLVHEIKIAEIADGTIKALPENFAQFENLLKDFCTFIGQTIKSSKKLASMMAGKARLLQNTLERAVTSDEENEQDTKLKGQYKTFKEILIHDLTPKGFSDIYAQTLAYGMFAARLHDKTLEDFSRQEAAELIPKSNPFLRNLFQYVSGNDIDERIVKTVDNLAEVFRATNIDELLHNFGKSTQMQDPIIHFYENFLAEYDPKLRKSRGVWYTPQPVVNFIVRAVDEVLKTDFELKKGIANTSKTKIKVMEQGNDKPIEKEVHKVQILDPATGTGTFLTEVVKHIYNKYGKANQGTWTKTVHDDLIPRLNGFELLMASYSMAHLKLDMLLQETGYKATSDKRFNIFLTNSLEEDFKTVPNLFMADWLSKEAQEANRVKRNTPVMCIIGNPPYSGESSNKNTWIKALMDDYKKEPGGKEKLKEQNSKFINDDYVKFLRYGQHFIEDNGSGVLAFINPHGFLDNPTFRGMRWNLLKTYDKIYTIDLHGNSKKKEVCPDGSPDVNVFDIMQGVSINIFVKTGAKKKNELGKVYHYDLFGKRDFKYNFLIENDLKTIPFVKLENVKPNYFFVPKNFEEQKKYDKGFSIKELFTLNSLGIQTHRDSLSIDSSSKNLTHRINDFYDNTIEKSKLLVKYPIKENSEWKLNEKRVGEFAENKIVKIDYRPFDTKFIYYDKNIVDRLRDSISKHLTNKDNLCLIVPRQCVSDWRYAFISKYIIESNLTGTAGRFGAGNFFPLYLYAENQNIKTTKEEGFSEKGRKPNLDMSLVAEIAGKLKMEFIAEPLDSSRGTRSSSEVETFAPIDILDYIYAVLHSPTYRETYKEFLKIDFPRVPYPKNAKQFWQLVALGGELRQVHLLEADIVDEQISGFPITREENNEIIPVTRKITKKDWELTDDKTGRIWINDEQYFDNIPLIAWEFYIGGYQPAQKWLKDRSPKKGQQPRELSTDDIEHYHSIIVALSETARIMAEINKIKII